MENKIIRHRSDDWIEVLNAARTTIGRNEIITEPNSEWKRRMLLAEHSPIRILTIIAKWNGLRSWVSQHFTRHGTGIEHFVETRRTDRTKSTIKRDDLPQGELVDHKFSANAQAIINISRVRLCSCASSETRQAWSEFLVKLVEVEPELAKACVPNCVYRGHCYELKSCNFHKSEMFADMIEQYRKGINE